MTAFNEREVPMGQSAPIAKRQFDISEPAVANNVSQRITGRRPFEALNSSLRVSKGVEGAGEMTMRASESTMVFEGSWPQVPVPAQFHFAPGLAVRNPDTDKPLSAKRAEPS